jgi:Glycosyl transferases group 1
MKCLFIDHPEGDFLMGTLYIGLCQELGATNVVDHPFKRSYHGELHVYPRPWASGKEGHTAPFPWVPAQVAHEWLRAEVIARIAEFDLIVASVRSEAVKCLSELVGVVGRAGMPPIVLVDGEDHDRIAWDLVDRFSPRVYFKRELMGRVNDRRTRVEPLPFASAVPEHASVPKDIDVLFLGGNTWSGRQTAIDALRRAFGDLFVGGVNVHYNYEMYLEAINRSKIAVSVRGHGFDTLRFWDIPSFETLLMADRMPLIRPNDFEHGQSAMFFHDAHSLVDLCKLALADDVMRTRVAKAGNVHLRAHHTAQARARQLIAVCLTGASLMPTTAPVATNVAQSGGVYGGSAGFP